MTLGMENRARSMGAGEAKGVGIDALAFLAGDATLLGRFLALSGLEAHELRGRAGDPAFFAGLLDFVLAHEPTFHDFAGASGHSPERIAAARAALDAAFAAPPR